MALHSSFTTVAYANPVSSSRQRQPFHFPYVSNNSISWTRHCRALSLPYSNVSPSLKATLSPTVWFDRSHCFFFILIWVVWRLISHVVNVLDELKENCSCQFLGNRSSFRPNFVYNWTRFSCRIYNVLVWSSGICSFWSRLLFGKLCGLFLLRIELGCVCWQVTAHATPEPLKIMISGAPASGKGTQCELITQKVSNFIHNRPYAKHLFSLTDLTLC